MFTPSGRAALLFSFSFEHNHAVFYPSTLSQTINGFGHLGGIRYLCDSSLRTCKATLQLHGSRGTCLHPSRPRSSQHYCTLHCLWSLSIIVPRSGTLAHSLYNHWPTRLRHHFSHPSLILNAWSRALCMSVDEGHGMLSRCLASTCRSSASSRRASCTPWSVCLVQTLRASTWPGVLRG